MRILMLGNSFTFANDMPAMLAELTGAEVVHHTRGGARLAEQLNPKTKEFLPEECRTALCLDQGRRCHSSSICHLGLSERQPGHGRDGYKL